MEPGGRFHVLPYDVNSTFESGGGRGFGERVGALTGPDSAIVTFTLVVP